MMTRRTCSNPSPLCETLDVQSFDCDVFLLRFIHYFFFLHSGKSTPWLSQSQIWCGARLMRKSSWISLGGVEVNFRICFGQVELGSCAWWRFTWNVHCTTQQAINAMTCSPCAITSMSISLFQQYLHECHAKQRTSSHISRMVSHLSLQRDHDGPLV